MKEFFTQISSFSWWLGVVVVGILINLAASYIKPMFDTILENISRNVRNKNEKKRKVWEENVKRLAEDDNYRAAYSNKINYWYLMSIHHMLIGVMMFMLALLLGSIFPEVEASILSEGSIGLIKSLLYLIGSLVCLYSLSKHKLANKMIEMLKAANLIIGNDY